jgi:DNA (cytosine-5)-methyltransferase 1
MKIGTDFSGIGAPEQALSLLGVNFETLFACEIDKYARESYKAIHPEPKTFYNDITKRDHSEIPQLDLYFAGFPCQSFSIAGKRAGWSTDENGELIDSRGNLFFDVAKFIKINQPKIFVLENVKGLLSHDKGRTYQTITDILTNGGGTLNGQISLDMFDDGLGYHVYTQVLNTKDFGIPQNRERIFIVGFKEFRDFSFPQKEPLELKLKDMLQDNSESKYYLSDKKITYLKKNQDKRALPFADGSEDYANCIISGYHKLPTDGQYLEVDDKYYLSDKMIEYFKGNHIKNQEKGNGFKFDPNEGDGVAKTVTTKEGTRMENNYIESDNKTDEGMFVADYRNDEGLRIRKDGNSPCLSARRHSEKDISTMPPIIGAMRGRENDDGKCEQNLEINDSGTSNTITSVQKDNLVVSQRIRRLTPLECWRLQAFPDEQFLKAEKVCSDTQLYKQAGNSISCNVLVKLLEKILK